MGELDYALTFTAPPAAMLAEATPACCEALLGELSSLRLACEARMAATHIPLLVGDAESMRGYLRELQASCGRPVATPPAMATEPPGPAAADRPK